jgi:hypothetical protein
MSIHLPFTDDGLLPEIDADRIASLLRAAGVQGPALTAAAVRGDPTALELAALGVGRWPVVLADGTINPPPPTHTLEALVHQRLLDSVDPGILMLVELMHLEAHSVAIIDERPLCDVCEPPGAPAVADARLGAGPVWAYQCVSCLRAHNDVVLLGAGRGQWLVVDSEVSDEVKGAFARARAFWAQFRDELDELDLGPPS